MGHTLEEVSNIERSALLKQKPLHTDRVPSVPFITTYSVQPFDDLLQLCCSLSFFIVCNFLNVPIKFFRFRFLWFQASGVLPPKIHIEAQFRFRFQGFCTSGFILRLGPGLMLFSAMTQCVA